MKWLLGILGLFIFLAFAAFLPTKQFDSAYQNYLIKRFVETHGASEFPKAWAGKMGQGI